MRNPAKQPARLTPEAAAAAARGDRRRILLMALAALMLAVGFFYARARVATYRQAEGDQLPAAAPTAVHVYVPDFEATEHLEKVRDGSTEQRLIVESSALDAVFDYARALSARQYSALGVSPLSAEAAAELHARPAGHRLEPYRAYGELLNVRPRRRDAGRPEEIVGTLALEEGGVAHFVVQESAELATGDFVAAEGLFLKLHRAEGPEGWWEGPLLVGKRLERAFPLLDVAGEISLDALAEVEDDGLQGGGGGMPEEAKWQLMALALAEREGHVEIDWESATEIDGQVLSDLLHDGDPHRGQPFVLPISRNSQGWVERVGENPLRLERISEGWAQNLTWKGAPPVVHWIGPFAAEELTDYETARFVRGRGFFFKNLAYERKNGDIGLAPLFVMSEVERFIPPADTRTPKILLGVLIATVILAALLALLLLRDKRDSEALQRELVRRRRARRERAALGGPPDETAS